MNPWELEQEYREAGYIEHPWHVGDYGFHFAHGRVQILQVMPDNYLLVVIDQTKDLVQLHYTTLKDASQIVSK